MTNMVALVQLFRYTVVGLLSNAILFLVYILVTALGAEPKLAMTALYVLGVLQTFLANRRWSFGHDGRVGPTLVRYGIAYALGYLLNLLGLLYLVDHLGYPHQIVQGFFIVFLAGLLFLLQKYWVFRNDVMRLHLKNR